MNIVVSRVILYKNNNIIYINNKLPWGKQIIKHLTLKQAKKEEKGQKRTEEVVQIGNSSMVDLNPHTYLLDVNRCILIKNILRSDFVLRDPVTYSM